MYVSFIDRIFKYKTIIIQYRQNKDSKVNNRTYN